MSCDAGVCLLAHKPASFDIRMKVFGVGMVQTGAAALHEVLRPMLFREGECATSCREKALHAARAGHLMEAVQTADAFKWSIGAPWSQPAVLDKLLKSFPHAKFILTQRRNAQAWWRSVDKCGVKRLWKQLGPLMTRETKAEGSVGRRVAIEAYNEHNAAIIRSFERANQTHRLMVVDLATANWPEFCTFLEYWRKCPHMAFPRDQAMQGNSSGCLLEVR